MKSTARASVRSSDASAPEPFLPLGVLWNVPGLEGFHLGNEQYRYPPYARDSQERLSSGTPWDLPFMGWLKAFGRVFGNKLGRPLMMCLIEGQTSDYIGAKLLCPHLPPGAQCLIGDKG